MKVFMCKRCGDYSGGLAVVAANSCKEAYIVFHTDKRYKWALEYFDEDGNYSEDPLVVNSYYYPKENWFEVPSLVANVDKPMVINEGGYTE
jgi:hypothetical protein